MIRSRGAARALVLATCALLLLPAGAGAFVSHKLVSGPNVTVPASGQGNPYPSSLTVDGLDGVIESMTVTFFVTHATPDDLDVLIVGPNGAKVVLMSDVGGTADLSNKQVRFKDGAAVMPDNALIDQVEYRPTNVGVTDTFPAPAPGGAAATTLGAAFSGINPNGQWRLFVIDDSAGTGGTVNSWRVTITTRVTIQGAGANIPAAGAAGTYPSLISIAKLRGKITRVEARINGISHNNPDDIDVLLLGPSGERVRLMSDAGGAENLVNVNLRFADAAASELPNGDQITAGTYKPTNYGLGDDNFPSPAPGTPYENALSVFNGDRAEGNWRLFVSDDESPTGGSFANWSLTLVTVNNPPSVDAIANQTIATGGSRNVTVTASDGEGDPLVFDEDLPNFVTLVDNGDGTATMRLRPDPGDAGTYNNVRVLVSDGEFSTSRAFNLTVTDATPPDTSAVIDPAPNGAGWNNSNVTVHITATDADSAIDFIRFNATGAQTIPSTDDPGPAADVAINTNGTTTVNHRARDAAGNLGAEKQKNVKLDKVKPTLTGGAFRLMRMAALGAGDAIPIQITGWTLSDTGGSGLDRVRLRESVNGGALQAVTLPSPLAPSVNVAFDNNKTYGHVVDGFDVAGNVSDPAQNVALLARLVQENDANIAYVGTWAVSTSGAVSGGSFRTSTATGATATFSFNGTHIGWVTAKCPGCGIAEVRVDGVLEATVDLFNASVQAKQVQFAKSAISNGPHTIEIRVTGNKNASSAGVRVDLDAMAFLDPQ